MKKTYIVMPAYNAGKHIASVFERIPQDVWGRIDGAIIIQDGSKDDTRDRIADIKAKYGDKILVIDKPVNEGYAKGQKDGFTKALDLGADIAILLHSDGQYAPELLPTLLAPLDRDEADVVQGSRMMDLKGALKGGMPMYKFLANVGLSTLENLVYGLDFSEYHSGYMLYSRKALTTVPYHKLSNTFHFDGEMLLVGSKKGLRIVELPISTTYEDDIYSNVKPIQYGLHVLNIMRKYLMGQYNF